MQNERRYELDWLRVIAVSFVLLYHVGMIFVPWDFHIKNSETSDFLQYIMVFFHQWRMPLLLFVSGAATFIALGSRTSGSFLLERNKRLLIPLILAFFVIVPPQIYIERVNQYSSFWEFYKTVFQFISYPRGSFSWHHMWFIAYLLCFTLISMPLLIWLRKNSSARFSAVMEKLFSNPISIAIPVILTLISQSYLLPYFPKETHNLTHDWAYFVFYYFFFLFGILFTAIRGMWQSLKKFRHLNLTFGTLSILFLWWIQWVPDIHFGDNFMNFDLEVWWHATRICVAWFFVMAFVGYAQIYLNFNKPILKHLNEAVFPFYTLHQTVVLAVGFFVIQYQWDLWTKFFAISLISYAICILVYWFWIRPFNAMRFLFGMKSKKKNKTPASENIEAKWVEG